MNAPVAMFDMTVALDPSEKGTHMSRFVELLEAWTAPLEDLVREVALALDQDDRIGRYAVEAENFESIHNHSAFARISRSRHGEP